MNHTIDAGESCVMTAISVRVKLLLGQNITTLLNIKDKRLDRANERQEGH